MGTCGLLGPQALWGSWLRAWKPQAVTSRAKSAEDAPTSMSLWDVRLDDLESVQEQEVLASPAAGACESLASFRACQSWLTRSAECRSQASILRNGLLPRLLLGAVCFTLRGGGVPTASDGASK